MVFFTCQNIPNHLARYILGILRLGLTAYVFLVGEIIILIRRYSIRLCLGLILITFWQTSSRNVSQMFLKRE